MHLSLVDTYSEILHMYPLATKCITSGIVAGVGDITSQCRCMDMAFWRDSPSMIIPNIDNRRVGRFMLTNSGSAIFWSYWFSIADFLTANLQDNPVARTIASLALEQFVWCPVLFSLYFIPVSTLLNGGRIEDVSGQVSRSLNGLLIANAKVWTIANVFIYNCPLEWRVAGSNCVDIIWASVCSSTAAECDGLDDEECIVPIMPVSQLESFECRQLEPSTRGRAGADMIIDLSQTDA